MLRKIALEEHFLDPATELYWRPTMVDVAPARTAQLYASLTDFAEQRLQMMDLLGQMAHRGRTILFSSHILEEVERMSGTIQVIVGGRLAASGDFRAIRRLMTSRPHVFTVRSSDDRLLGGVLIGRTAVTAEPSPLRLEPRTFFWPTPPFNSGLGQTPALLRWPRAASISAS